MTYYFDSIATGLHALAAVIWVGGMFFAYICLRPVAGEMDQKARLSLWRGVFGKFFPWVWMQVLVLLATGYAILFYSLAGFAGAGLHVHIMHLTGWVMVVLFVVLYYLPWKAFREAVDRDDREAAGRQLERIRQIVLINLCIGLLTVAVGASGRFWG